jgi:hypothetical protein
MHSFLEFPPLLLFESDLSSYLPVRLPPPAEWLDSRQVRNLTTPTLLARPKDSQ